jgi:hypothetical protein
MLSSYRHPKDDEENPLYKAAECFAPSQPLMKEKVGLLLIL